MVATREILITQKNRHNAVNFEIYKRRKPYIVETFFTKLIFSLDNDEYGSKAHFSAYFNMYLCIFLHILFVTARVLRR